VKLEVGQAYLWASGADVSVDIYLGESYGRHHFKIIGWLKGGEDKLKPGDSYSINPSQISQFYKQYSDFKQQLKELL